MIVLKLIFMNAIKVTDFVFVSNGVVVFFWGDYVYVGMCGMGCVLFWIYMYCVNVEYEKDVVLDVDWVCFMIEG